MSAPVESLRPRDAPRSASSASSSLPPSDGRQPRRMRRSTDWQRRSSALVDVQDTRRIFECSQLERQLRFQHLVRQYLSQILHGCKSAYCDTPSCFSCTRRNASRPFRPPTQLTARALAHYLASQDHPDRGLCAHELKVSPSNVEIKGDIGPGILQGRNGEGRAYAVYPATWRLLQQYRATGERSSAGVTALLGNHNQSSLADILDAVKERRHSRKDLKSLVQNLYDSATIIYSYSKQIPTPAHVLALLRSPSIAPCGESFVVSPQQLGAQDTKSATNSEPPTNEQYVTPQTDGSSRLVGQTSQQDSRIHSTLHSRHRSSELLSNGQYIHRIPYHPQNTAHESKLSRTSDPPRPHDSPESPKMSIMNTGKKSFTIGGTTVTAMQQSKPPASALEHAIQATKRVDRTAAVLPVFPHLDCDILDELKEDVSQHRRHQSADFNFVVDYDSNRRFQPTTPFVNRTLFHTLSDPDTLLRSFHERNENFKKSPVPHLDSTRLANSFRDWSRRNGALVFDSLWIAVEALFTPPPELDVQKSPRLRPSRKGSSVEELSEYRSAHEKDRPVVRRFLTTHEAAHIIIICIHALTSLVPVGWAHTWAQLRTLRSWGVITPNVASNTDAFAHPFMDIIDELEYEPALRLVDRLLRGIGARMCFEHILASLNHGKSHVNNPENAPGNDTVVDVVIKHLAVVECVALTSRRRLNSNHSTTEDPGWTVTATFMEWLRTIIIKKWNNKAEINKWSSVGAAVILLDKLYTKHKSLNLQAAMFDMPFFNERLDTADEPLKFLNFKSQPNVLHILQFPSLFPAQHLVAYFRTINFTSMMAQYDQTTRTQQMHRSLDMFLREPYWWVIKYRMKVTLSDYLVLDVSRENPLKDTLDQLWGQERRMLLKPLKVKMGQQEGEVGLDHGGVTNEFFRVVLMEAFQLENGMFTIDPQTRMTWFQPSTLEPQWKFEMLGIVFSLAIYNGVTLPVTFPLAFYRFLLPQDSPYREGEIHTKPLDRIADGWPDLAKALSELLAWSDGDVGDVIMREYAFSYEVFGRKIDHNMKYPFHHQAEHDTLPDPPEAEPELVTNETREQFVCDYVNFLTYSSVEPQLQAFLKGFLTCINPKSLHFFTPTSLRNLIEGTQYISIPDLRRSAKYEEGYTATHSTIRDFWAVVETYTQEDCRHLLEFVTASDRIPVTGYESITFHIVRIGGEPTSLPTSSTCFGKLYLPQYSDREVMRRKLDLAIKNSKGFGVV